MRRFPRIPQQDSSQKVGGTSGLPSQVSQLCRQQDRPAPRKVNRPRDRQNCSRKCSASVLREHPSCHPPYSFVEVQRVLFYHKALTATIYKGSAS